MQGNANENIPSVDELRAVIQEHDGKRRTTAIYTLLSSGGALAGAARPARSPFVTSYIIPKR